MVIAWGCCKVRYNQGQCCYIQISQLSAADNSLICRLCAQCMISNNNNINQFTFLATICLSLFSSKQCIIKQYYYYIIIPDISKTSCNDIVY